MLRARLAALDGEFDRAEERRAQRVKEADDTFRLEVAGLEEHRDIVHKLLQLEERLHGMPSGEPQQLPLGAFILRLLKVTGPKSKEEVREAALANGYGIVDRRSIHALIHNMVRVGRVTAVDDERFALVGAQAEGVAPAHEVPFGIGGES